MLKNPALPLIVSLIILAGACYTSIPLNILVPATSPLNPDIKKISIIPMIGAPSAPGTFDKIRFMSFDTSVDIQEIKMGYLHGLFDVLSQSPVIKRIIFADSSGLSKKSGLYWDELKDICKKDSTQYVLILNRVVVYDFYDSNVMLSYDHNYYDGDITLLNYTKWSFYNPENEQVIINYDIEDTIKITGGFSSYEVGQLLYNNCFEVGERTGKRLVPYWKETTRLIYTGPGRDLKDASQYIYKNQWYKASRIWNDMMTGYGRRKTSHAAFNIAVAFEQNDDLDQALAWLNYSDSLKSNDITRFYIEVLKSRIKLQDELDKQIPPEPFVDPVRKEYKSQNRIPDEKKKKIQYYDFENSSPFGFE